MSQIKFSRAAKDGHSWHPEVDMLGLKLSDRREPALLPLRDKTMLPASYKEWRAIVIHGWQGLPGKLSFSYHTWSRGS